MGDAHGDDPAGRQGGEGSPRLRRYSHLRPRAWDAPLGKVVAQHARHQDRRRLPPDEGDRHGERHVASRLKDVGYITGFFGKYNNDYDEPRIPPGWDRWFAFREPLNRADWYEFNSDGKLRRFYRATDNETDVIASRVVDFVRSRRANQPWLAYVCPHDPHGPYYPAPRHEDEFQGATWDPASEGEADLSDKPALVRSEPTYTQVEEAQNEQEYRGKLRELQAVDDLVRKVLSALTDTGQLQNTYVFFFTDNGYLFGEHRLQKKNLPYDEACRTPFIARGPSVLKLGFESNALVSQLDVAPTLCAIGGASTEGMDGRNLLPILAGEEPEWWRRCLMIENVEKGWYSLRTPTHWYTEWNTGEKELYDLRVGKDPEQMESLHRSTDPAIQAMIGELSTTLGTLRRCSGQSCRRADGGLDTGCLDRQRMLIPSPSGLPRTPTFYDLLRTARPGARAP